MASTGLDSPCRDRRIIAAVLQKAIGNILVANSQDGDRAAGSTVGTVMSSLDGDRSWTPDSVYALPAVSWPTETVPADDALSEDTVGHLTDAHRSVVGLEAANGHRNWMLLATYVAEHTRTDAATLTVAMRDAAHVTLAFNRSGVILTESSAAPRGDGDSPHVADVQTLHDVLVRRLDEA